MSTTLEPKSTNDTSNPEFISSWFDNIFAILRTDELLLTTGTASEATMNVYNTFFSGDVKQMAALTRKTTETFYYSRLLLGYIKELGTRKANPSVLAFDYSDSKVLVWAEVPSNENDETIDKMLLAEAKMNAEFSEYGFHISTMFVEETDKMVKPEHYRELPIKYK